MVKRRFGNAQGPAYTDDFESIRIAQIICLPSTDPKYLPDFIYGIGPFPYAFTHASLFCNQKSFLLPSPASFRAMQCTCMIRLSRPSVNDMASLVISEGIHRQKVENLNRVDRQEMFQAADGTSAT